MKTKRKIAVHLIAMIGAVAAVYTVPIFICSRGADRWIRGDKTCRVRLAKSVAQYINRENTSVSQFHTGDNQFDGEWLFGTYQMAGIGFCQMALQHPELQEEYAPLSRKCIELMLTKDVRAFDAASWGEDPIDAISGKNHHAAYLGYLNFLLGLHRVAFDDNTYAELNDRITESLIRNLQFSTIGLLETYPGEIYPVDNCFVIGSIGLHQGASDKDHSDIIKIWVEQVRKYYLEEDLLIQAVYSLDGKPADRPRGSGTSLGLIALHYADPQLAQDLYKGIKRSLAGSILGFGTVREYLKSHSGWGDIDSGPIIFGYGMSATGFSIAGALRYGDEKFFKKLYATAKFCGAEIKRGDGLEYVSGGPLGNAILFAMYTTPRVEVEKF